MIKRGVGLLVVGFAVACGGGDPPPAQSPALAPVQSDPAPVAVVDAGAPASKPSMLDLQAAVEKALVANANDAAKMASLYAPDATLFMPGIPLITGRDQIQAGYQMYLDSTTGLQTAHVRQFSKGNQMLLQWVSTATDKKSGKPWGISGAELVTLNDDGLITSDRNYFDPMTVLKQTGAYKGDSPARAIATLPTTPLEVHVAKNDATEATNLANMTANAAAWGRGDVKALVDNLADDAVLDDFTADKPDTKASWAAGATANFKTLKDFAQKNLTLFAVEDFTIQEGEFTCTMTKDLDIKGKHYAEKGKTITIQALEIDQWKDAKTAKSWAWSNNIQMASQLGMYPPPAATSKGAPTSAKKSAK